MSALVMPAYFRPGVSTDVMEMEETGDADNLTLLVTTNDTFRVNDTWLTRDTNDTCVTTDNVTVACVSDGEESDYLYKV